ncbi:MAG: NAD-dependent epimerase/dehydratase [Microgenomates bacterium 39_6]|nr:MAG: NAD-dependent epimerase/dehydratase [Microgenomates bacterium 39_6]
MKVLITGGVGFLGLHLAHYYNKQNHQVSLLDIADFNPKEFEDVFSFHQTDVRDKEGLDQVIKGQDLVIHAAAALPLWTKRDILTTNIDGTRNVLSSSLKHNVQRVIFISSTAVYGVPEKHPIDENDPLIGVGPYGESKIEAEKICQDHIHKGINITIIRPKTFIGTRRLGVFEILFDWIKDGKKIPVIGNGKNRYQLLDVDDLVEAIYLFGKKNHKKYNDTFNIGAKEFATVKQDLHKLCEHAGSGASVLATPAGPVKAALALFDYLGISPLYKWVYDTADKDSFVSTEKIEKTLNWSPKYSNQAALIKAYSWYLDNYESVKATNSGVTHTTGWKQGILKLVKKVL